MISLLDSLGEDQILNLSSFITNNCAGRLARMQLLIIKLKAGLDKFQKELQMYDNKEKIDYFLERNKAMIKFAQEIQDARRICIESTNRLLEKRALGFDPKDKSSIRSDLKDRLSLMNRFLSVIGKTMSGQCNADKNQFRLDFSEVDIL